MAGLILSNTYTPSVQNWALADAANADTDDAFLCTASYPIALGGGRKIRWRERGEIESRREKRESRRESKRITLSIATHRKPANSI